MLKTTKITAYIPIEDFLLIQDIAKANKTTLGGALTKLLLTSNKWRELKDQDKYAKAERNLKL
jgi:hypothetical protein